MTQRYSHGWMHAYDTRAGDHNSTNSFAIKADLREIDAEFETADVALINGANDVINAVAQLIPSVKAV